MTIKFRAKTKEGYTVDSPLQPFFFPDGAAHVKGGDDFDPKPYEYQIADIRGFDHSDLFALAMWENVCTQYNQKKVVLLPYLPGARADRGVPFGANVYAEFLNNLFLDQVVTLDPHSAVMPMQITNPNGEYAPPPNSNNVTVFPFTRIIKREIQDVESDQRAQPYVGVIAPDHGAVERATQAAKVMGVPVYKAEKSRDFETGKLTGFHMIDELPDEGRLLIVDDICDGGGTFLGLADAANLEPERVDLWVTHGVFSKGVNDLLDRFGEVHTTDSYFDPTDERFTSANQQATSVTVHKILPYLTEAINL